MRRASRGATASPCCSYTLMRMRSAARSTTRSRVGRRAALLRVAAQRRAAGANIAYQGFLARERRGWRTYDYRSRPLRRARRRLLGQPRVLDVAQFVAVHRRRRRRRGPSGSRSGASRLQRGTTGSGNVFVTYLPARRRLRRAQDALDLRRSMPACASTHSDGPPRVPRGPPVLLPARRDVAPGGSRARPR